MFLSEYLNLSELEDDLDAGYVNRNFHDSLPLVMYTYSRTAQFDGHWTDATRKSRGLIVDLSSGEVVAFCMPKFFNYSEHVNGKSYAEPLPEEPFEIYSKIDGSMGTVFHYAGEWHVATKGSFHSDQAKWATAALRGLGEDLVSLIPGFTYVCEIIYPENRIVVDYGDLKTLVLLTVFDRNGREAGLTEGHRADWVNVGLTVAPAYSSRNFSLSDIAILAEDNRALAALDRETQGVDCEGYVIKFSSGVRCKIKLSDYLRMHKILTNCTERSIWEVLYQGSDLSALRENVPDEFDDWVSETEHSIMGRVKVYESMARQYFMEVVERVGASDRKAFALEAQKTPYAAALFRLYDGKSLKDLAFKSCYPKSIKPFRTADE